MSEQNSNWTCYNPPEFNAESGKWEIKVADANGEVVKTEEYNSQTEADEMFQHTIKIATELASQSKEKPLNKKQQEKANVEKQESVLEKKLREAGATPAQQPGSAQQPSTQKKMLNAADVMGNDEKVNEEIQKFDKEYADDKEKFVAKAKAVLTSVAKFYLGNELFTKSEAAKYRIEVEEMGFSALMLQLEIAQKAMYQLSKYITLGVVNSRLWEVMSTLQKTVLETVKYQHEYMDDIGESMKKIREDIYSGNTGDTDEMIALMDKNAKKEGSTAIDTASDGIPDRKMLIDGMNQQLAEMKQYMKIPSHNKKLADEEDDLAYAETIISGDNEDNEVADVDENRGLSTFEGENEQPVREGVIDGDEEDDF